MQPVRPAARAQDRPARNHVHHGLLAIVAVLVLSTSALAQGEDDLNVTRLGRFKDYNAYNDVWGFALDDGREYACVGTVSGTVIVNCTDPTDPYETGFIDGTNCTWRDMKYYQGHVYSVNDCIGGVQVIDVTDPEAPVLVNEFGNTFFNAAHNVQIDADAGILYACGTNKGMCIYDLNASLVDPPLIRTWNGQGISGFNVDGYVHDLHVQDGIAYVCMINDGLFATLDVSDLPTISKLDQAASGEDFTHSCWVSEDNTLAVVADETGGTRHLQLWDVSDPTDISTIKNLWQGPQTIPHNPYIVDGVVHTSYYKIGYVGMDVSDPLNPVRVAEYDTLPNEASAFGFDGAWGCYPLQPSGFVYVNDISTGFHILKVNEPCEVDTQGRPSLCEVWPEMVEPGATPLTIVSGAVLSDVTAVHVDGITLAPGQFEVLDDQVLTFTLPSITAEGLVPITVENAAGESDVVFTQVRAPGGPRIDVTPTEFVEGDVISVTLESQPFDLHYLGLSFTPQPSVVPQVSFDIGAGFSDITLLPPIPTGATGTTVLPPLEVPAGAVGVTVYWQFAAITAGNLPAPVSNVSISTVLE